MCVCVCLTDWNAPAAGNGNSQSVNIRHVNCHIVSASVYRQVFYFFIKGRDDRHENECARLYLCRHGSVFSTAGAASAIAVRWLQGCLNVNVYLQSCYAFIVCTSNSTEKHYSNFVRIHTDIHTHSRTKLQATTVAWYMEITFFHRMHNKTWIHFIDGTQQ